MTDYVPLIFGSLSPMRVPLPRPRPKIAGVPLPRPDPRGSTFVDRIPQGAGYDASSAGEIPPELMIMSRGYLPSRKQGDAIDFPDNPLSPWYRPIQRGI